MSKDISIYFSDITAKYATMWQVKQSIAREQRAHTEDINGRINTTGQHEHHK